MLAVQLGQKSKTSTITCSIIDLVQNFHLELIHLEHKSVDDWVSACRGLVVEEGRGRGRSRKTWEQCVKDDLKLLGLHSEWAIFRRKLLKLGRSTSHSSSSRLTLALAASTTPPPEPSVSPK